MGKANVEDFDPDVCMGRRNDVSGVCSELADIGEDTGRPLVDALAKAEGFGLSAISGGDEPGPEDFKCGMCGCPLPNLQLFDEAPTGCPRLAQHNQSRR